MTAPDSPSANRCSGGFFSRWINDPLTEHLCSNFSLLALPHAFRGELSALRRLAWAILFLGGLLATIFFTIRLTSQYLDYESTTSVAVVKPDSDGLIFPAVTIWNVNPVRKSQIGEQFYEEECGLKPSISDELVTSKQPLPKEWTEEWWKSAAHQLDEMLLECEFNGEPCSAEDFDVTLTPFPDVRWGMGYTFNFDSHKKTTRAGSNGGLKMVLDAQRNEYCPRTWGTGFRIQLHAHEDLPTDGIASAHIDPNVGLTFGPGKWWSFSMTRVEHHSLGTPYGPPCIDLKNGDKYPDPNAALTCVDEKCAGFSKSDITDVNLLSIEDECVQRCFAPRKYRFCDGATFPYSLGVEDLDLHLDDEKRLAEKDLDTLRKSSIVGRFLKENTTIDSVAEIQEVMSHNVAVINVFYKSLLIERREQVSQSSIWTLFGEIGGIAGLFLGVSMVTALEFFEISCVLLCCFRDRYKNKTGAGLVEKYALSTKADSPV